MLTDPEKAEILGATFLEFHGRLDKQVDALARVNSATAHHQEFPFTQPELASQHRLRLFRFHRSILDECIDRVHAGGLCMVILNQVFCHWRRACNERGSESLELLNGVWIGVVAD